MKKIPLYRYSGLNGIIDSPVLLEDVPFSQRFRLIADQGHYLTNGTVKNMIVEVYEDSVEDWTEVEGQI